MLTKAADVKSKVVFSRMVPTQTKISVLKQNQDFKGTLNYLINDIEGISLTEYFFVIN